MYFFSITLVAGSAAAERPAVRLVWDHLRTVVSQPDADARERTLRRYLGGSTS